LHEDAEADYHRSVVSIGIVGGSGFTGAELLRLCAGHPDLTVELATGDTQVGAAVADAYPSLAAAYPELQWRVAGGRARAAD
jgi:N-acetyl-gamma-glutamylphosphate reductase